MGRPRWEVADNEMGRRIYHRRRDVQDGKWQVMRWEDEVTTGDGTSKMGSGRQWVGKTNLPQEIGRPRWEMAGNEMGRRIYLKRWDVQDGKWQVMRWEDEFTTRRWDFQDGKWQVMTWEDEIATDRRWDVQDGKRQVMRWEDEFTTEDGTSKMWSGWDGKANLPQEMGRPRWEQVMRWEDEFTTRDETSKMGSGR